MSAEATTRQKGALLKGFKGYLPIALFAGAVMVAGRLIAGIETGPQALSMEEFMKFLNGQGFTLDAQGQIVPLDGTNPDHPGFAGDNRGGSIYEDPGVTRTDRTVDFFPNLKNGFVTYEDYLDMVKMLADEEARAELLLKKYLLLIPPTDQNAVIVRRLFEDFNAMHEKFAALGDDFKALDAARNGTHDDFQKALAKLQADIATVKGLDTIRARDLIYETQEEFLKLGSPGEVIYTDPVTGKTEWRSLKDIPGIDFKKGALDDLPITTSGKFYWYYRVLAANGILDPVTGKIMPGILVTEGFGLTTDHISQAHRLGMAIDFVPQNGDYSPRNVAHFIGLGRGVTNVDVYFESPNLSDAELAAFREDVAQQLRAQFPNRFSLAQARAFAESHVLRNDGATDRHFHFEITGATRVQDRTVALER